MGRDVLVRALVCLCMGCGGATAVATTGSGPQMVSVEDLPTGASISEAYRFALTPSRGWRILREDQLGAFGQDIDGGATRTDGAGWGLVVVESMPGMELAQAADLVFDVFPSEGRRLVSQEQTRFRGFPAIRQVVVAHVQGMAVRWTSMMFMRDEHLYRLTVWGDGIGDSRHLETFYETFALLEGQVVRPPREAVADAQGDDWRLHEGTFTSLAAEVIVSPPSEWRLTLGNELRSMNADAAVGLVHEEPDVYAIVIAERVPPSAYDALGATVLRTTMENLGARAHGERSMRFLGRDLSMRVLRGRGFEYLFGVDCNEGLCRQLMVWYVERAADRAARALETFPEIRHLSGEERAACASALAASRSDRRTVGPAHAFRGNTYVDFARGLTLRLPPHAYWRVHNDEGTRERNANIELSIENATLGISGIFMTEPVDAGLERGAYHSGVREAVGIAPGTARRWRMGEIGVDVSEGSRDLGFGVMDFRVITARVGDRGYRFAFWGWPEHMRAAAPAIDALLAGVTLHADAIPPFEITGDRFVDHRFGYSIQLPPGPRRHSDDTPPHAQGPTSVHTFAYPDGSQVQVLAVHTHNAGEPAEFVVRMLRDGFARRLSNAGTAHPSTGTLAGRHAEVTRWSGGPVSIETRITAAGSIAYGIVVIGRDDADAIARGFELLP